MEAQAWRRHGAATQQAHVIDAVRARRHPGDQARHLQMRADSAFPAGAEQPGPLPGQVGEAATEFRRLLDDYTRLLGPDHPATLRTRKNLAHWKEVFSPDRAS